MATETTTLIIESVSREVGDTEATITLGNQSVPPVYVDSTILINNRRTGNFLPVATVTEVTNGNTVVVTGLSALDVSDFEIPDDEIGAVGYVTNTYPVS